MVYYANLTIICLQDTLAKEYSGRIEVFSKNIFQLPSLSYLDKIDNGGRVEAMLANVPVRDNWSEGNFYAF